MARLTIRRLEAMEAALSAMLAGEEGQGDWPEGVSADAADAAHSWVIEQIEKRRRAEPDEETKYWRSEANKVAWREARWGQKS